MTPLKRIPVDSCSKRLELQINFKLLHSIHPKSLQPNKITSENTACYYLKKNVVF
jgi:hypothetical protein